MTAATHREPDQSDGEEEKNCEKQVGTPQIFIAGKGEALDGDPQIDGAEESGLPVTVRVPVQMG